MPLRVLLAATLAIPLLVFGYAAILNYIAQFRDAEQRLHRMADVVYEHATKVFETHELVVDQVNEIIADMSDTQISAAQQQLHLRFAEIVKHLPQIQDIYVFSADGRALASAMTYPLPAETNFSDRDYFAAQRQPNAGTYISTILSGRLDGTRFFNFSKRRPSADGRFNGVTIVSVQPSYFEAFYSRAAADAGGGIAYSISLVRSDGYRLVRYPYTEAEGAQTTGPDFAAHVDSAPLSGLYDTISVADGTRRIAAYKRLEDYPVYVLVGLPRVSVIGEWQAAMASHLVFGVPATLCLFGITWLALRRAAAEAERRHEIEEAMRQSQKLEALGKLTGGVAHDFNNLLTVVVGNAEIAKHHVDDRGRRMIDGILRAAERGETLTRQLLSFSRRQALAPKVLDLRAQLPKTAEILARSLPATITPEVTVEPDIGLIEVDPGEFELALLNLALNARDAMPNGGKLRLDARNQRGPAVTPSRRASAHAEGFVAISVADTGEGMAPDIVERAFEPFFTTKDVNKGTGLGLSQVYGFAHQSGGSAIIESVVGWGTTVTLLLPRAAGQPAAEEAAGPAAPFSDHLARRILVVEDSDEVGMVLSGMLNQLGYAVIAVDRAHAALERLARDGQVDLVLSDIMMPGGMTGIELAREIRIRYPGTPILLSSGYSEVALAVGDEFAVLRKPFTMAALDRALHETLRTAATSSGPLAI